MARKGRRATHEAQGKRGPVTDALDPAAVELTALVPLVRFLDSSEKPYGVEVAERAAQAALKAAADRFEA